MKDKGVLIRHYSSTYIFKHNSRNNNFFAGQAGRILCRGI